MIKRKTKKDQDMEPKKAEVQPDKAEQDLQEKDATTEEQQKAEKTAKEGSAKSKKAKSKKKEKTSREEEYKEKIEELNDKFLRLYSEFDNYRRRTSKEKLDLAKTASEELIIDLLPVLDDFERAIKSAEEVKDCDAVKEGMQLIYSKLNSILTKKGLAPIEAKGNAFDTDYHEAITYIPAPSDELKGKVVDEVEKGYMLQEKVIRYTKVIIGQ
jgi:molecular chaperone GrpE